MDPLAAILKRVESGETTALDAEILRRALATEYRNQDLANGRWRLEAFAACQPWARAVQGYIRQLEATNLWQDQQIAHLQGERGRSQKETSHA